ncbi:hypothetical protein BH20ACT18_BH20ACT18_07480 [soil metagenome]
MALLAMFVLALALPASASASPLYEPNDGIHQAFGPLQAGTNYDAAISSYNDTDWYVAYVSTQGVLDVGLTNTATSGYGCCLLVELFDQDGTYLNSTYVSRGTTEHLVYTTLGAGVYYVKVRDGVPANQYRLRVTGPLVNGPRPGPAQPTPNNNPTITTAFGPLLGGVLYGGSIDADGEEDWFYFHTARAGAFDVAFTNIKDAGSGGPLVELRDQNGKYLNSKYVGEDTIAHLSYTALGPATFALRVRYGNPVDRYQFRISPASLLTTSPPPAAPPAPPPPAPSAPPPAKVNPPGPGLSSVPVVGFSVKPLRASKRAKLVRLRIDNSNPFAITGQVILETKAAKRRLQLGSAAFSVPAGKTVKVKVKLSKQGRRLLLKRRQLRGKVTIVSRTAAGATKTITKKVKLRAP